MIIRECKKKDSVLYRTVRNAVIIRIFFLIIIAYSGSWELSLVGQRNVVSDDFKYEQSAVLYEQSARTWFDVKAFTWAFNSVDSLDWTGERLDSPISNSVLWYFAVCFLVWIFKSKYAIRLFNIFLFAISLKYIHNFTKRIWGQEVADRTVSLYAYLPYPIIFSCFGYKEELALFCTFYLLSYSVDIRIGIEASVWDRIKITIVAIIMLGIRSGISLFLMGICIVIIYAQRSNLTGRISMKKFSFFILMSVILICVIVQFGESVLYKMSIYLGGARGGDRGGANTTMSFLLINGIMDFWKIPFSYMFSIVSPISLFQDLNSWWDLISNINICLVPISVGAVLYMFLIKKTDKIVYWSITMYYMIHIIASLGIPRHYFSLMPFNLIYFSAFTVNANRNQKLFLYVGFVVMVIIFFTYYMGKRIGL